MGATTSPEDYRRFEHAASIEFYTDPAKIPGPAIHSPTSDWGVLSRASSGGSLEPMDAVVPRIEYPGGEPSSLPDIALEFAYTGSVAGSLFEKCHRMDEAADNLPVYLWRFRITGHDGEATELCFRACLFEISAEQTAGQGGRVSGTFRVLDSQPFIAKV